VEGLCEREAVGVSLATGVADGRPGKDGTVRLEVKYTEGGFVNTLWAFGGILPSRRSPTQLKFMRLEPSRRI
jgi:hypothetical protein